MQPQQTKGFCQGCLHQFHLFFLHPKPLAQGLQGLMCRTLTGPRSPVHPAPALLRAAASEASKPRGPWLGRREGSTRTRAERSSATPRGRCRAWGQELEGALWSRASYSPRVGSRGAVTGPSEATAPQHKQARDRSRQQAREGGGPEWGRAAR